MKLKQMRQKSILKIDMVLFPLCRSIRLEQNFVRVKKVGITNALFSNMSLHGKIVVT